MILGVNAGIAASHDPAACVVNRHGEVLAYVEQERVTRVRHAPGDRPAAASDAALRLAGASWADVEVVAVGWDEALLQARVRGSNVADVDAWILHAVGWPSGGVPPRVEYVEHHRAHAWSAVFTSPYQQTSVVVADGNGEYESTSIFSAQVSPPDLRLLKRWPRAQSLGYRYEATSAWLGLGGLGSGKTMGLAAWGRGDGFGVDPLVDHSEQELEGLPAPFGADPELDYDELMAMWSERLQLQFGPSFGRADVRTLQLQPRAVAAALAAQLVTERSLARLVSIAREDQAERPVCFAGGVALNCSATGRIGGPVYTPPVPHDAGVAIGAAWEVAPPKRTFFPWSPYLGRRPGAVTRSSERDLGPTFTWSDADVGRVAQLLIDGAIGGVARGRAEVGPRALCHRSLLASPSDVTTRERLNERKQREPWRPFGPVAVDSSAGLWKNVSPLDLYMVGAAALTDGGLAQLPAVAHVDGTTRPQVLTPHVDPWVRELLDTTTGAGLPALVNTSFNGPNEPIVDSAFDAIRSASNLDLDFVVIDERMGVRRVGRK